MALSNPFLSSGASSTSIGDSTPGPFAAAWGGPDPTTAWNNLGALISRGFAAPTAPPAPMDWGLSSPGVLNTGTNFITNPESGGNPNAANPRSSATGLGQFLDSTWNDADLKQRAGYANVPAAQWKKLKTGPDGAAAQIAMTQAYAQRNAEHWQNKYGTAPTQGQVYGMHFLDGAGFTDLVDKAAKDPTANAAAIFPAAAEANPNVFYKDPATRKQPLGAAELVSKLQRIGGDTQPFTMPDLAHIDPKAAMASMPDPAHPTLFVNTPAPLTPDLPPRPLEDTTSSQSIMDTLRKFAPKSFDEKEANKGRLGSVLAGIAKGAAGTDQAAPVGMLLAAMGAGAAQNAATWDQGVKAKKETMDDAQRLFELGVAQAGISRDDLNHNIQAKNLDAQWQDQRDKLLNTYKDQMNQHTEDTQALLKNNGLENDYSHLMYDAAVARARVGLQATEFNTQETNRQFTGQQDLDLKRFIFQNENNAKMFDERQMQQIGQQAATVGLIPKTILENKDLTGLNALQGIGYVVAGNKPAAIGALAKEMVQNPTLDAKGQPTYSLLSPQVSAQIMQVAKQSPELAIARVKEELLKAEADPATKGITLQWAKQMAGRGLPFATYLLRNTKKAPALDDIPLSAGAPPPPVGP